MDSDFPAYALSDEHELQHPVLSPSGSRVSASGPVVSLRD